MSLAVWTATLAKSEPICVACFTACCWAGSCRACWAICWNCWVSAPHHCMAVAIPAAGAASAAKGAAGSSAAGGTGAAGAGSAAAWAGRGQLDSGWPVAASAAALAAPAKGKPWARSARFTFMPCKVDSVMRCTCKAWTVALRARLFCSSQNCTALSSSMRLSISSTLTVGATQWANGGTADVPWPALPRFCKKSKPGMNLPKPKAEVSLIASLQARADENPGASSAPGRVTQAYCTRARLACRLQRTPHPGRCGRGSTLYST